MKHILAVLLLLAPGPALAQNSTVQQLPAASNPLSGTEAVYCVQGGADKQCSATQIAAIGGTSGGGGGPPGPWVQVPWQTLTAGTGTVVNGGVGGTVPLTGLACGALRIVNLDAALSINVRWDGTLATSTSGEPFAPGSGLFFTGSQVPTQSISAFSTGATQIAVSYQPC